MTPDAGTDADTSSPPRPRPCAASSSTTPAASGPKRGEASKRQPLDAVAAPEIELEVVAIDEALEQLAEAEPIRARLVELRYFAGLSIEEAAEVVGHLARHRLRALGLCQGLAPQRGPRPVIQWLQSFF